MPLQFKHDIEDNDILSNTNDSCMMIAKSQGKLLLHKQKIRNTKVLSHTNSLSLSNDKIANNTSILLA